MSSKILAALLFLASGMAAAGGPELPASYQGQDAEHWFKVVSGMQAAGLGALDEQRFSFVVDLDNSPSFSLDYDAASGRFTMLYRMAFNNVAEGWSWEALANPESADYYRFKFLPLLSTQEEKSAPVTVELYPGMKREVKNLWRYDYFLAFENLYDFYPRKADDDAGFGAAVSLSADQARALTEGGNVRMLARFRLKPPYHSESNTFWKADFADPVDFTLRKRYLVGELLEVWFYDHASGKVLARLAPVRKD